jgi:hypothetical protein
MTINMFQVVWAGFMASIVLWLPGTINQKRDEK